MRKRGVMPSLMRHSTKWWKWSMHCPSHHLWSRTRGWPNSHICSILESYLLAFPPTHTHTHSHTHTHTHTHRNGVGGEKTHTHTPGIPPLDTGINVSEA